MPANLGIAAGPLGATAVPTVAVVVAGTLAVVGAAVVVREVWRRLF